MGIILERIKKYNPNLKGFSQNLSRDGNPDLGLTLPECREIAKELALGDYKTILKEDFIYYEEQMICGLIIGYLKIPFSKTIGLLKDFVTKVDNWAVCDSTISTLKSFKKNKEEGLKFIDYCFNLKTTFQIRFAYVLLLNYYIEEKYLDYIFDKITKEELREYYVQMAVAWLISFLFIKFPKETLVLFDGRLDKFTNNKAISKIRESFRATPEQKEMIKEYRMK